MITDLDLFILNNVLMNSESEFQTSFKRFLYSIERTR